METTTMTRQYIIARHIEEVFLKRNPKREITNYSGEPYICNRWFAGNTRVCEGRVLPDHIVQWQVIHGGRLQIRVTCNYCKRYIAFAQKNERNVRLADAARTFKG